MCNSALKDFRNRLEKLSTQLHPESEKDYSTETKYRARLPVIGVSGPI